MKLQLLTVLFIITTSIGFAVPDTLLLKVNDNGIECAYLLSHLNKYDPECGVSKEEWSANFSVRLSGYIQMGVDNSDTVVLELIRCPNSKDGKPRFRIIDGIINPTDQVLNVDIPFGYAGIHQNGVIYK